MALSGDCQNQEFEAASTPAGFVDSAKHRVQWHLRQDGLWLTLRKVAALGFRRLADWLAVSPKQQLATVLPKAAAAVPASQLPEAPLNLQTGDWVEIKPMEEICQTLDSLGRCQGLIFMPTMADYCGQRARVLKRVDRIILEHTGEARTVKHTVLLEGAICAGAGQRCDRGCFYFWKEAWLRRAAPQMPERAR